MRVRTAGAEDVMVMVDVFRIRLMAVEHVNFSK
jgi:hypothetical protein